MHNNHYCFDNLTSSCNSGRLHIPLAINCHLYCGYCNYFNDKNISNGNFPGTTVSILNNATSISQWLKEKTDEYRNIKILGIAGPGDPLSNPIQLKLFFEIVNRNYQNFTTCLCTSGLNFKTLESFLFQQNTLKYITFTINSRNSSTIKKIYNPSLGIVFNEYDFIDEQEYAIKSCISHNLNVKINCVYLPTINDDEIFDLFNHYNVLGVQIFNILSYKQSKNHAFSTLPKKDILKFNALLAQLKIANINLLNKCFRCQSDECGFFNHMR